jgi:hypothetical protein
MISIYDASVYQKYQSSTPVEVTLKIHNLFLGAELVSPVYACDGAICYLSPDQRVNAGSTAQISFSIGLIQGEPIGILMYELKNAGRFDKYAITGEDEAICTQLVMIWKVYKTGKFCVRSGLIEHDKGCVWDRDRLMRLAKWYRVYDIQRVPVEVAYLMRDNTVLMKKECIFRKGRCYELEVDISERSTKYEPQRPWYFDVDRQVPMMMLVTIFAY